MNSKQVVLKQNAVADSAFPRGCQFRILGCQCIIWPIFADNCIKRKEIELSESSASLPPSPSPASLSPLEFPLECFDRQACTVRVSLNGITDNQMSDNKATGKELSSSSEQPFTLHNTYRSVYFFLFIYFITKIMSACFSSYDVTCLNP